MWVLHWRTDKATSGYNALCFIMALVMTYYLQSVWNAANRERQLQIYSFSESLLLASRIFVDIEISMIHYRFQTHHRKNFMNISKRKISMARIRMPTKAGKACRRSFALLSLMELRKFFLALNWHLWSVKMLFHICSGTIHRRERYENILYLWQ